MRSNLQNYSDAYKHVTGIIKVPNTGTAATRDNRNEKITFQNQASFNK